MTEQSLLKTTIVVMGVSGCGKSTVAQSLAERLGWPMAEGDDLHSPANKAKMASGTPLTDEDRIPWLESIRDWIDRCPSHAIVTCSALKRSYRDILRTARGRVRFLQLDGSPTLLGERMAARKGHFMPAALLISQLETLERLGPDEDGAVVDIDAAEDDVVDRALSRLGLTPAD